MQPKPLTLPRTQVNTVKFETMCLLLAAYGCHADYRLIIAANRDEFYNRDAAPAGFWTDYPNILGGRDLRGGGSWLAVNRQGVFAAITNVRATADTTSPRSRGLIVSDYLTSEVSASQFVDTAVNDRQRYEGFNLLASDNDSLVWYSNSRDEPQVLQRGVYGLSNAALDTPWPKVARIKHDFLAIQSLPARKLADSLFAALANENPAPDAELPSTGVGLESERVLSPIFISGDTYGTRCSTVVLIGYDNTLTFIERRFGPQKSLVAESEFEFDIECQRK